MNDGVAADTSLLTSEDVYLFREGTHNQLYRSLGAHATRADGTPGVHFAVWAPNAASVSVIGEWNQWNAAANPMTARADGSGIWEGFVAAVGNGARYKYHVASRVGGHRVDKADPFAFFAEAPPRTASRVWNLGYQWGDDDWMSERGRKNSLEAPWSIYELHIGSWRRAVEEDNRSLSYRELAGRLADYLGEMGFTHVELLPVMEHPFYGSWGYQTTGYFAPSARYGTPQDLMYLIDLLHQRGFGVILDWVPSHFPADEHGLSYFDGTYLYEHQDPRQGYHPEWHSHVFNYGRHEVRAFLLSSALYWLDNYHVDAIRVDAVASMLYLDYGRKEGEWIPNEHGGRENLEALSFLKGLNEAAYSRHPDTQMIAEESTAWPMVSRPTYLGGLGFGMKWNMGWMHDTLEYMSVDPVFRKYHHNELTFSIYYAFSENFVLPLSHDEVVYGKRSLLGKMAGDEWQAFANLRTLYGYMFAHPGKKLLFMGGEFGQWNEWDHEKSLDWNLLDMPRHFGLRRWYQDLNHFYKHEPALWQCDFSPAGFEWVDVHDSERSIISFLRHGRADAPSVLVICNFTPVPRANYRVGVPSGGLWEEALNSDASLYGGTGQGNWGGAEAAPIGAHGRYHSLNLTLPPLSALFFKSPSSEAQGD